MKFWQVMLTAAALVCISFPTAFANGGGSLELGCNEEVILGPGLECKIEVKCYHEDIEGYVGYEELWNSAIGPFYALDYEFLYTYDVFMGTNTIPVCYGIAIAPIGFAPNTNYHCTENAKGKNSEGDVAVEIEIKLGTCYED